MLKQIHLLASIKLKQLQMLYGKATFLFTSVWLPIGKTNSERYINLTADGMAVKEKIIGTNVFQF
jgi:hypothetical protein